MKYKEGFKMIEVEKKNPDDFLVIVDEGSYQRKKFGAG